MDAALRQLSDASYEGREKAMAAVKQALAEQMQQMLGRATRRSRRVWPTCLSLTTRWCAGPSNALTLSAADRAAQLKWGVSPEVYPLIARIYSTDPVARMAGIKELGKLRGDEASCLLGHLLADDHREVYLAAMEAVWDRAPTPAMIDALWSRAVEASVAQYRYPVARANVPVQFHGKTVGTVYYGNMYSRMADNDIATDVLIHFKSPLVGRKIKDFLAEVDEAQNGEAPGAAGQAAGAARAASCGAIRNRSRMSIASCNRASTAKPCPRW